MQYGGAGTIYRHNVPTLFAPAVDIVNTLCAVQATNTLPQALKAYVAPRLLLLDELGYLPMDKRGADLLFQVIRARYERGAILITTHTAYKQWPRVFNNDATITTAILDRLVPPELSAPSSSGSLVPLYEHMRQRLPAEQVAHVDETGWRKEGVHDWLWCVAVARMVVYHIDRHRSSQVVEELLGQQFGGVLISNFLAAYNRIRARKQRCLVHLLRLIKLLLSAINHPSPLPCPLAISGP